MGTMLDVERGDHERSLDDDEPENNAIENTWEEIAENIRIILENYERTTFGDVEHQLRLARNALLDAADKITS